jgi:hypothetical protein
LINKEMAKDYLFRAERCLKEAFLAIKDEMQQEL